ncbi:tripartite tricarboxylate transporter TctB family protein [Tropicimonas isoalkanivorans]|uniref:Tripartite tricarboxylate transporter TctB family protein n=1 Tax=Tropicimonas isoalkanivorans TaxID=441112 RepID=A0A1I1Q6C9_9RHOB|nr:tripartite tricarboxylate transporter TctB family protein [Tropicimonas isoalkanivorans]SFD17664.1 Tripartite tricarboxylate transporter TctB family protein [Tropicimonas isoalkanivorans]
MGPNNTRKPGEAIFALLLALLSLGALVKAYGISGFEGLSSPGAFPMAAAAVMLLSALVVTVNTLRASRDSDTEMFRDILPANAVMMAGLILLYAIALRPLGFLPTSLIFLFVSTLILAKRGVIFAAVVSVLSLAIIYIVFRLVFSVLMPEGVVPEREILAWIARLASGGAE